MYALVDVVVHHSLDMENFFPGSGILFVTVTVRLYPRSLRFLEIQRILQGHFAKRIEHYSDERVKEEVLSVLRSMYPNQTIPEPVDFYFPRWHSDPLYRGSFSNWPASLVTGHHFNLRATVADRVWFAGEATSQKYFGKPIGLKSDT